VTANQSDETIAHALRQRLEWDPEMEGVAVAVRITDGVAILEGTVRPYQRAAAERLATETPGVCAIDNRLQLSDPLRLDDQALARLAVVALEADPVIPAAQIVVAVQRGIVELRGDVERGAERLAAEAAVVDLPGVVDVHNLIVVAASPPSAADLTAAIQEAYVAEATAASARIAARVEGGRVTLTGTTPTPHFRQLAERAVWRVSGVGDVLNEIRVEP
jgi:osmotically-inducible protein OsmY